MRTTDASRPTPPSRSTPALLMRAALIVIFAGAFLLAGCGGQKKTLRRQARTIDSLRAENKEWRTRTAILQDSLRFYDDVDSGRYYRALRVLRDRLERMRYDVTTLRDGGRTIALLPADELFEPASATLSEAGKVRLDTLASQIQAAYPERPVRVEGHSDNLPLSSELQEQYPSNWELSAARAAAAVRYLIEMHELAPERFQIAAFADTRPVAGNDTRAGRRLNRRVRIAVLPAPRSYPRNTEASW